MGIHAQLWTILDKFWTFMDIYGHLWTFMDTLGHKFDPLKLKVITYYMDVPNLKSSSLSTLDKVS